MMKLVPAATPPETQKGESKTFLPADDISPWCSCTVQMYWSKECTRLFHVPTTTYHKLIWSMIECFFFYLSPARSPAKRLIPVVGGEKIEKRIDAPWDKGSDFFFFPKQWRKLGSEIEPKRKKRICGCVPRFLSIVRHMECVLSILHSIAICWDLKQAETYKNRRMLD